MLYTIFRRKSNLKRVLLDLNIFGSSEYEKMAIFLKTVRLCFAHFLRLLTYNKYKNYLQPNLLIFLKCLVVYTEERMCVRVGVFYVMTLYV